MATPIYHVQRVRQQRSAPEAHLRDMGSLTGKRVWITGASAGIGAALAEWAAEAGASVTLSARRQPELAAVAARLPHPDRHQVLPLDLGDADTLSAAAASAGEVDFLILNGGISQRAPALATELAVTRRIMEVNFFGNVALTRAVAPGMVARGSGRIVAVSSVVGYIGTPLRSTYAASKHALHGYYDSLRYELAREGVGVTLVCPGYIRTDISRNAATGDGSPQGTMDRGQAEGMSAGAFAKTAWRAILAGKPEAYIGGKELGGIYLKRYLPRVLDRLMLRRPWDNEG